MSGANKVQERKGALKELNWRLLTVSVDSEVPKLVERAEASLEKKKKFEGSALLSLFATRQLRTTKDIKAAEAYAAQVIKNKYSLPPVRVSIPLPKRGSFGLMDQAVLTIEYLNPASR